MGKVLIESYRFAVDVLKKRHSSAPEEDIRDAVSDAVAKQIELQKNGYIMKQDKKAIRGWLVTTARRILLESINNRQYLVSLNETVCWIEEDDGMTIGEMLTDDTACLFPEQMEIRDLLNKLKEQDKDILLKNTEGYTFAEIAEICGGTQASVKMRYGRSIDKLRKLAGVPLLRS